MSSAILECRQVSKTYGGLVAVDNVDLRIAIGETVGIGGPNGAGKTTFFDLISGLVPVTSGSVQFQGTPIVGKASHELFRAGLARTFQVASGFMTMTVYQNMLASVVFGAADRKPGILFSRRHHAKTMEALERFGLADVASKPLSDVPMLVRKKLMVASAVAHAPKLILLDEPVGGLIPSEVEEFIEVIRDLRSRGICVVFVEHVMRFHMAVADRIVIMNQGKIIFDDKPSKLAEDATVRSVYLGMEADDL